MEHGTLAAVTSLLILAPLPLAASGQQPEGLPPVRSAPLRAAGLAEVDGRLAGGGPGYAVSLEDGALAVATRDAALRLEVESVRRGAAGLDLEEGDLRYAADGRRAQRAVAAGVDEHLEATVGGLELSYSFAALPGTQGDLVVRLRVETDLAPPAAGRFEDGVVFGAGPAAMRVGAVTGVDAAGRRAAGSLRFDGAALELVLPGAFVDTAALPLVLDPLVGSAFPVSAGAAADSDPSAAYDASNDVYLVAWTALTATTREIRIQRVTTGGALVGPLGILVSQAGTITVETARVGNCSATDRFLVVWTQVLQAFIPEYTIRAAAVSAATGAVSGTVVLDTTLAGTQFVECPAVTSESAAGDQDLLVVYLRTGEVLARSVTVPAVGIPSAGPAVVVATGDNREVDVSPSKNVAGNHLVVWARFIADFNTDAYARVLDDDGNPVGAEVVVSGTPGVTESPRCDATIGARFAVAVSRGEGSLFSDPRDVLCIPVEDLGPFTAVTTPIPVATQPGVDERDADVAFVGGQVLVSWIEPAGPSNGFVVGLDPHTLSTCEPEELVAGGLDSLRLAPQLASGGAIDRALATWATAGADVTAQPYRSEDGVFTDAGGGCGQGGTASATCARVGNAAFTHRVNGLPPTAATAVLVTSFTEAPMGCGSCVLLPELGSALVFVVPVLFLAGAAFQVCLLYTSPSPRDLSTSRMPSSA